MTEGVPVGAVCRALPWDSEFFGFPVASVIPDRLDPELAARIDAWCLERGVRCVYFLADSRDPAVAACAEASGFRLVDIRFTLERSTAPEPALPTAEIGAARAGDVDALVAVAVTAHEDSRFYADPGFDRKRCAFLYETWIRKSLDGWADTVLVARIEDRAAGYLTCHLDVAESTTEGRIGLVGVAEWARGRGLASALVNSAVRWFGSRQAKRITVVTQGRNIPAQRLYMHAGFSTSNLHLWFHKWYRGPEGLETP